MIPPFNKLGYLPEGIFPATLSEIDARFGGGSEIRRVQMESLRWMVELAIRAGVQRIILNGSFVTDIMEPNDVDCALLIVGDPVDVQADSDLAEGLPFLEINLVRSKDFDFFTREFFAQDRHFARKGMIEVIFEAP